MVPLSNSPPSEGNKYQPSIRLFWAEEEQQKMQTHPKTQINTEEQKIPISEVPPSFYANTMQCKSRTMHCKTNVMSPDPCLSHVYARVEHL